MRFIEFAPAAFDTVRRRTVTGVTCNAMEQPRQHFKGAVAACRGVY